MCGRVLRSGQSGCEDIFLVEDRVIYDNVFTDGDIVACEDVFLDQDRVVVKTYS